MNHGCIECIHGVVGSDGGVGGEIKFMSGKTHLDPGAFAMPTEWKWHSVTDCFSFLFVGEVAAIVAMGGLLQAVSKQTLLNCLQIRGIGNGMVVFFIQNLQIVKVQIGKCIFFLPGKVPAFPHSSRQR